MIFAFCAINRTEVQVFCVVTPCSDVAGYQRFGGPRCLHLQGAISQNTTT
jgi:hypothetical protein